MSTTAVATTVATAVAPNAVPSAARRQGEVRLTRRGRLVVLVLALLVVLTVGVALGGGSAATGDAGAETTVVVVDEGDTLWGIASEHAADGVDVRSAMVEIERLNRLESKMLTLGQRLHVPVES